MRVDALVLGAGHNGLVTGTYLARAGLRTAIVERRPVVGGACVTEELWPGFRVSRAAYVAGLLRPRIVRELALERRGLRLLPRDPSSFTPQQDGPGLVLGPNLERSRRSIERFSKRDAERYPAYESLLDRTARALEPLLDRPPPDPARPRVSDLPALATLARGLVALRRDLPTLAPLLLGSARGVLEDWFESEPLRATLATDALIGAFAGPSTPGSGYVLFHHVMGETNGVRGVWAYVAGGMGGLAEALARAAREAGCEIHLETPVRRILSEGGRVQGVELEDGTVVEALVVVSNADPQRTLLELADPGELPDDLAGRLRRLDFQSPAVKINLALDGLPRFAGLADAAGAGNPLGATIHFGCENLDVLEASFQAASAGRLPDRFMAELTLPSVLDPSLAPPGRHVASLFVQHVPPDWSAERWEKERERVLKRVLRQLEEVAPGFSERILHAETLAPPDLERLFGLTGGNLFHGAMSLDRLLFLRPLPGWSRYRTPIDGLYLCGAGTHPGGGVMGACGRNAAREILRDHRTRAGRSRLRAWRSRRPLRALR